MRKTTPGAPHATEIPYVFDTVAARYGKDLTPSDAAAARTVHRYWVAFAASGKPEVAGEPSWPAYQAHSDKLIDFTDHGPVVEADTWKPRLDLAQRVSERKEHAGGGDNASQVTR